MYHYWKYSHYNGTDIVIIVMSENKNGSESRPLWISAQMGSLDGHFRIIIVLNLQAMGNNCEIRF